MSKLKEECGVFGILDLDGNNFIRKCNNETDFYFNNKCYESCPNNTKIDENSNIPKLCICNNKSDYSKNGGCIWIRASIRNLAS